jgi:hypothetical protein
MSQVSLRIGTFIWNFNRLINELIPVIIIFAQGTNTRIIYMENYYNIHIENLNYTWPLANKSYQL